MTDADMFGGNAAEELKYRIARRVEKLDEIEALKDELKEYVDEDKADGYSEKAIAQAIKETRKGAKYSVGQLTLELEVDTYRTAAGLPVTLEAAQKAAALEAETLDDEKPKKRRSHGNGGKAND